MFFANIPLVNFTDSLWLYIKSLSIRCQLKVYNIIFFSQVLLDNSIFMLIYLLRRWGFLSIVLRLWLIWDDSNHSFSSIIVNQFVNASTFLVATTSSTGGCNNSPPKGYCYCLSQRSVSQAFFLVLYKAVPLESSFLKSSTCSLIYFWTASSVILPIVST